MRCDLYTKAVLTVIAAALVVIAGRTVADPRPVEAVPYGAPRLQFDPDVTKIAAPDGSSNVFGRVAIDLETGDVWGFPTDELGYPRSPAARPPGYSSPVYLGQFELRKIKRFRRGGRKYD